MNYITTNTYFTGDDWSYKQTTTVPVREYYPNVPYWKDYVVVPVLVPRSALRPYPMYPSGCANCPNHPMNGGSGVCHCVIGSMDVR